MPLPLSDVTIATSIAPSNLEHQKRAVRSWKALGFSVVSVNNPGEIDMLHAHFPDVQFVKAQRHGQTLAGKPYVYFDDVLQALAHSPSPVVGIVNSDIYLKADDGFIAFVGQEAADAMLFVPRLDVVDLESDDAGKLNAWGFDAFFFPRHVATMYPATEFLIGVPWWDYWAPLVPLLQGIPGKRLLSRVALHVLHEQKWSLKLYEEFGRRYLTYLRATVPVDALLPVSPSLGQPSTELESMVMAVYIYLRVRASKVRYGTATLPLPAMDSLADLPETCDLLDYHSRILNLVKPFQEAHKSAAAELEDTRTSLSWQVTRPLRWLRSLYTRLTTPVPGRNQASQ